MPAGVTHFRFAIRDSQRTDKVSAVANGKPVDVSRSTTRRVTPVPNSAYEEEATFDVTLGPGSNQIEVNAYNQFVGAKREFHITAVAPAPRTETAVAPVQPSLGLHYYALVIGNNRYQHVPSLNNAVRDAQEVDQTLRRDFGFTTKLLIDATREQIMGALNAYRRDLGENDALLIYYSGHGSFDKDVDKAYWLPVEAQNDDSTNWISADDVTTVMKGTKARHVLVVADSCFSGMIARSAEIGFNPAEHSRFVQRMAAKPSRVLLASGGNEPVSDGGGERGHSVFASAFLKGLAAMDAPVFTVEELFLTQIREPVAGRSAQVPECSPLRNSGHDGGTFVFQRRAGK